MRKRLLKNAFSARVAGLAVLSSVMMLVHRGMAVIVQEPVHAILAFDSLLFSGLLLGAAITLARWMVVGAVFTLVGSVLALVFPHQAPLAFSASTVGMLLTAAVLWKPENDRA
jgi:hypothetical protein